MLNQKRWTKVLLGSVVVLSLVLGSSAAFAQTNEPTETTATAEVQEGDRGPRGNRGGNMGNNDEFLADALGISVEELQAAKTAVREATDGAETDKDVRIEMLADELGVTVETLQAAFEEAHAAAIEQAIADGLITEEDAALMEARQALRDYIDHDEIMASVLGVTVAELEAAKEAGTVDELIEASGLDREEIRAAMDAEKETAVQDAVDDGVLTEEQAEQLENGAGGRGKPGGPRGGNGAGVRGPRGGNPPAGDNA